MSDHPIVTWAIPAAIAVAAAVGPAILPLDKLSPDSKLIVITVAGILFLGSASAAIIFWRRARNSSHQAGRGGDAVASGSDSSATGGRGGNAGRGEGGRGGDAHAIGARSSARGGQGGNG